MTSLNYKNMKYICGFSDISKIPSDRGSEIAFVGYSNSGKSSVINSISGNSKLSKTSKKPGCTKKINFFYFGAEKRIVDLPGYGYASVPHKVKNLWEENINLYLKRKSLIGMILIADVRHALKPIDKKLIDWASAYLMRLHVVLTKSDKLQNQHKKSALDNIRHSLLKYKCLSTVQLFSSYKKTGIEELTRVISMWFS